MTAGALPTRADRLLRGEGDVPPLPWLLALVVVFGLLYGGAMGTYWGPGQWPRLLQVAYSASKVPLLLLTTFVIGLPSFWVLNQLMGVGEDFGAAVRALMATQAGLTIILASLAPVTVSFYASVTDYDQAVLFNALIFAVASASAQILLRRYYRPLIEKNPAHRLLLRGWLAIYAFVGVQMGWVLRPFIGDPRAPTEFFRRGAWGNAYVEVADKVWGLFR